MSESQDGFLVETPEYLYCILYRSILKKNLSKFLNYLWEQREFWMNNRDNYFRELLEKLLLCKNLLHRFSEMSKNNSLDKLKKRKSLLHKFHWIKVGPV